MCLWTLEPLVCLLPRKSVLMAMGLLLALGLLLLVHRLPRLPLYHQN
jgi:hypothetical protein